MKIIFGTDTYAIERHAKAVVSALDRDNIRYPNQAVPKGVAFHLTRFPNTCDECGNTFWANNQWATHLGCPGSGDKKEAGFGFGN